MRAAIAERGEAVIVLATGASQFETNAVLTAAPGIAWDRVGALLVALLILTTQRHEEELAESRAQLTLHIATLSERKIAKVIELLEEQRRDNPLLPSRIDDEATEMAQPADHKTTLGLIDEVVDQRREPTEE